MCGSIIVLMPEGEVSFENGLCHVMSCHVMLLPNKADMHTYLSAYSVNNFGWLILYTTYEV